MHWLLLAKERSALSPETERKQISRLLQQRTYTLRDTATDATTNVAKVLSSLRTWLGLVDMFQDKMQHFSVRVNVPATTNNGPLLEF